MKDLRHTLQYLLAGIALLVLSAAVMPIALAADSPSAENKAPKRDVLAVPNYIGPGMTSPNCKVQVSGVSYLYRFR